MRLPVWPIFFMTLWDFYVGGVRPFDQLVVLFYVTTAVLQGTRVLDLRRVDKALGIVCLMLWITVLGCLRNHDAWRSAIGLIEGCIVVLIMTSATWDREGVRKIVQALILINAGAILLQFVVYKFTGSVIHYYGGIGLSLRGANAYGLRPAGLYMEPADYSLIMFSVLVLYRLNKWSDWRLELLGLATMLLTISLWGWGAVLFYICLFRPRWLTFVIPPALVLVMIVFSNSNSEIIRSSLIGIKILQRFSNHGQDTSTQTRYGALAGGVDFSDWEVWFGKGLSEEYFDFGHNGLSFILTAGGIFVTVGVVALWFWILPPDRRFKGTLCLLFMLSATTQWTYLWWWAWLALAASVVGEKPAQVSLEDSEGSRPMVAAAQ
jgi:hypothetical protein